MCSWPPPLVWLTRSFRSFPRSNQILGITLLLTGKFPSISLSPRVPHLSLSFCALANQKRPAASGNFVLLQGTGYMRLPVMLLQDGLSQDPLANNSLVKPSPPFPKLTGGYSVGSNENYISSLPPLISFCECQHCSGCKVGFRIRRQIKYVIAIILWDTALRATRVEGPD